jgi:hypothetical protein
MLTDCLPQQWQDQQQRQQNNNQLQLHTRFFNGDICYGIDGMTIVMVAETAGVVVTMDINNMILNTDVKRLRISGMLQMVMIWEQGQRQKGQDQHPAAALLVCNLSIES